MFPCPTSREGVAFLIPVATVFVCCLIMGLASWGPPFEKWSTVSGVTVVVAIIIGSVWLERVRRKERFRLEQVGYQSCLRCRFPLTSAGPTATCSECGLVATVKSNEEIWRSLYAGSFRTRAENWRPRLVRGYATVFAGATVSSIVLFVTAIPNRPMVSSVSARLGGWNALVDGAAAASLFLVVLGVFSVGLYSLVAREPALRLSIVGNLIVLVWWSLKG